MSDTSSLSTPTRPSASLKQEIIGTQAQPVGVSSGGSGNPNESQIPEPPPGGGNQPGDEVSKAPPSSNL